MTNQRIIYGDAVKHVASQDLDCDVMITDPPYSPHVHASATSNDTGGMGVRGRDLGFGALTPGLRDWISLTAAANIRRWSVIFSDHEGCQAWRDAAETEYIRQIPWIRWSQPQLSGDRPPSGAEAVLLFHGCRYTAGGKIKPVKKRWNGPGSLTHFDSRCLRGKDKHPTEKPIGLALSLVSWFSDPGDTVFDPCAGGGTIALACRLLGRSSVSIERDEAHYLATCMRLASRLSARDHGLVGEWVVEAKEEVASVPTPKAADGSDKKTYERGQRRLADAVRVDAAWADQTEEFEVEEL